MAQGQKKIVRRNYFVKKQFQFSFILKFCILIIVGAAVSTGLLYFLSKDTLTSTYRGSRLVVESTASAMLPGILYTNLITIVLISLAAIVVTLLISHKIAGPLFRFQKEIRTIGTGDLTVEIFLRSHDQVTELAQDLNHMTAELRKKVAGIDSSLEELANDATAKEVPEAFTQKLASIQEKLRSDFIL